MTSPYTIRCPRKDLYILINDFDLMIMMSELFYYRYTFVYFWDNTINMLFEVKFFIK